MPTETQERAARAAAWKHDQWTGPWRLRLICCGRDEGSVRFQTSEEADAFRESYTSGPGVHPNGYSAHETETGHKRAAIKEYDDAD